MSVHLLYFKIDFTDLNIVATFVVLSMKATFKNYNMKKLIRELQDLVINSEIDGLMMSIHLGVCVSINYSIEMDTIFSESAFKIGNDKEGNEYRMKNLIEKTKIFIDNYKNINNG